MFGFIVSHGQCWSCPISWRFWIHLESQLIESRLRQRSYCFSRATAVATWVHVAAMPPMHKRSCSTHILKRCDKIVWLVEPPGRIRAHGDKGNHLCLPMRRLWVKILSAFRTVWITSTLVWIICGPGPWSGRNNLTHGQGNILLTMYSVQHKDATALGSNSALVQIQPLNFVKHVSWSHANNIKIHQIGQRY